MILPGTQFTAPPPTTPGEVGAGPRTPGEVTLGLVMGVGPLTDELPTEDPVIGCGVEPKVPVIGSGVEPKVPPAFGLEIPGAELPPIVGEVLNVPDPVIGAGPVPGGVVPEVPAAPGAAVWAKDTGATATNATATAEIMDFRLSMKVSF